MSPGGLHYGRYPTTQGNECLMRIGEADARPILFVPPLLEEMNRARALIAAVMRILAARGFGCRLIDLPGTGESERALETVGWDEWRHAVKTAAAQARAKSGAMPLIASIRGGCLIDDEAEARGWWRFAPVAGASLARDMERAGLAGVEWAGYAPSDGLKNELRAAEPAAVAPLRTVRLASGAGHADAALPGPALWRRSEPGQSAELAEAMAEDLATWSGLCAG